MKHYTSIALFLLVFAASIQAQTLKQMLYDHYEVVGIKHLKDVNSISYAGSYNNHYLKLISNNVPEELLKPDFVLSVEKHKSYLKQYYGMHGENAYGFGNGKYWTDPPGFPAKVWAPSDVDRF